MEQLKALFADRPHWMNALMLFCAYMTFIYMPFDLFWKPVAQDEEVWFGYQLHGWAAKATEPIHWLIYGGGFYGFLKMKSWMFPWAALYTFQIAIAMAVYSWFYSDAPLWAGLLIAAPFTALGVMLWMAKLKFSGMVGDEINQGDTQEEVDG